MADELSLNRVLAATSRLAGVAHRTPVLSSAGLDERCGVPVWLKAEPLQRSGSFKFRGAYNRLSVIPEADRAVGVVAFSSGNHGAAVALAAKLLGMPAVVVVPANGAPAKLAAIEGYGAELRRYDPVTENRDEVAAQIAADRGMTVVRPFDDYDVMAGQGTVGVELTEQVPDVELVLVPVGGGGLAAGVSTAVTSLLPGAAVIGVEPEKANDTAQSVRAGRRVRIADADATLADGLRASQPGELTFEVNSRLLKDVVTVTEEAIVEAMRYCFERLKLVAEPSGAVPLAALLSGVVSAPGRTAVVVSGGNIDAATFASIIRA